MQIILNNENSFDILEKELQNYPIAENPSIVIRQVDKFEDSIICSNPSSQLETKEGFIIKALLIDTYFKFKEGEVVEVNFIINEKEGLKRQLRKWVNNQFTNRLENIGQILHENVLVPLMLLRSDRLITHASGVQLANKKALLFGGTGGVGKTSLEIKLCMQENINFVADDISVVDNEGNVFLNLNYPKIYAYNLQGNVELKKRLLDKRSLGDSLQWNMRKNIGLDKVRRKVDPSVIYSLPSEDFIEVQDYYFLFRSNEKEISTHSITAEEAKRHSTLIIKNEYSAFLNHIRWHEYNRKALNLMPLISEKEIDIKLDSLGSVFFKKVNSKLLKIPYLMPHNEFMDRISEFVATSDIES